MAVVAVVVVVPVVRVDTANESTDDWVVSEGKEGVTPTTADAEEVDVEVDVEGDEKLEASEVIPRV